MVHDEVLSLDEKTGRCVWALRHIPSGNYGDPYDWALILIRENWDSELVEVKLCQGMSLRKRRLIARKILSMGFSGATANEGSKRVKWLFHGPREILETL
ncbi:MAG: hypothetical protein AAF662_14750 [Pseudomonadota bacterium]